MKKLLLFVGLIAGLAVLCQVYPPTYPYPTTRQTNGAFPAGTKKQNAPINATAWNDDFSTSYRITTAGGDQIVGTTNELSKINPNWRQEGMQAYVIANNHTYRLTNDLTTWNDIGEIQGGSGGGGGSSDGNLAISNLTWNADRVHIGAGKWNIMGGVQGLTNEKFGLFGIGTTNFFLDGKAITIATAFEADDGLVLGGRNLNITGTVFNETSQASFLHTAGGPYTVNAPAGDIEINSMTFYNGGNATRIVGWPSVLGDNRTDFLGATNAYISVSGTYPSGNQFGAVINAPALDIGAANVGPASIDGVTALGTVLGRHPSGSGMVSYMQMDYRGLAWAGATNNVFWASNTIPYYVQAPSGLGPLAYARVHLKFEGGILTGQDTNYVSLKVGAQTGSIKYVYKSDGTRCRRSDLYQCVIYTLIYDDFYSRWILQGPGYFDVPRTTFFTAYGTDMTSPCTLADLGYQTIAPLNTTEYIIDPSSGQDLLFNSDFLFNVSSYQWAIPRGKMFTFSNFSTSGFTATLSYFDGSMNVMKVFTDKTWAKFVWNGTTFLKMDEGAIP